MDEPADGLRLAYITCPDAEDAERIGRILVEERLAACINLLPGMRSLYRWQGAIECASEVVLIAKTTVARCPALLERVRALHRHSVPCVLFLPVAGGNPAFLQWLRDGVAEPSGG
jgi:periplasmic divalent cation tolerance protein